MSSTTAVSIHADRAAGRLEIAWDDGHETAYDTTTLRWLCPCAFCRGEAGMPGWLDSDPTLTAEQTRLVDISMVGRLCHRPPPGPTGITPATTTFTMLRDRSPARTAGRRGAASSAVGADRHEEHA